MRWLAGSPLTYSLMVAVGGVFEELPGPAVSVVDLHIKAVRMCEEEVSEVLKGGQDGNGSGMTHINVRKKIEKECKQRTLFRSRGQFDERLTGERYKSSQARAKGEGRRRRRRGTG